MAPAFEIIDSCPVPSELAELVHCLKADVPGAVLQSAYRGDDVAPLLHRLGKHTQAELYAGWAAKRPGFLPANPPDRGTHLLLGDGTVGRLHERLDPRRCGQDWDDAHIEALIRAAAARGWVLYRPYASGSEYHHLCAKSWPALGAVLGLGKGSKRASVEHLTRRLGFVSDKAGKPYFAGAAQLSFDAKVEAAVKAFQRDHDLTADGKVGPKTWDALDRSVAYRKAHPNTPAPKKSAPPARTRKPKATPTVAEQAAAFIAPFEGCPVDAKGRPVAYRDAVGVLTLGFGHTRNVKAGQTLPSRQAALDLLAADIKTSYLPAVDAAAKRYKRTLSDHQRVSLCSAVYNLGPGILEPGRSLGDALAHNLSGVPAALKLYDKAGGRALAGLTRRRAAEAALWSKS